MRRRGAMGALACLALAPVAWGEADLPQFNVRTWDAEEGQPTTSLRGIARTPDGYLWLATREGLARFDGIRFVTLTTNTTPALGDNRVSCLLADAAGDLWVGTEGGTLACRRAGKFVAVPLDRRLQGVRLNLLAPERDGGLWLATTNAGLVRYRDGTCEIFGPTNSGPVSVRDLVEDRLGRWWAIVGRSLVRLEHGRWQSPADLPLLPMPPIALAAAADGGLWVATWYPQPLWGRGACLYKLRDGEWQEGPATYPWPQGTKRTAVQRLIEDHDGRLWVGLRGAGVFCREPTGRWHRPGPGTMLYELEVRGLLSEPEGALWIGSEGGELHRVERRRVLALELPPAAERSVVLGCCASQDGRLWVPNQHAVIGFDPAAVRTARRHAPVMIEELLVDGVGQAPATDGVFRIPSAARRLELRYTCPVSSSPERVRFRVRLTDYDQGWVDAGSRRAAFYQRVPPGRYEFQVEAGGLDGAWQASPRPLLLEIVPRLVERAGFRWAVALASLGGAAVLLWASARVRLRRRVALLEAQHTVERERARIARDLHDDIGSRLTELVLMSESAPRDATTVPEMRARTVEVTQKLRRAVAAMDQVVWSVNPEHDDLPHLADYLSNYAQEVLATTPVHCRLDVAEDLPVYSDSSQIFRALQAGASGYLLKRLGGEELLRSIAEVMQGGAPMTGEIARKVIEAFRRPQPTGDTQVHLSSREEEVLSWVSHGYSNKEIASQLGISVHTVGVHLANIYAKLQVRSRTEATAWYLCATQPVRLPPPPP